jgi:class 3 adenylate cyclase
MAVFIGDRKNSTAARVGLKINYARTYIIQPAIKAQYPLSDFKLNHMVGIDTSELLVTKTGIRGANDLLWMGKASNHAAKLCSLSHNYSTRVTKRVFDKLNDASKIGSDGRSMWEASTWTDMNNAALYRSTWSWSI